MTTDFIIGHHGILEAARNPHRKNKTIFGTKDALDKFFGSNQFEEKIPRQVLTPEQLQKNIQEYCKVNQFQTFKLPTKIYLQADGLGETHVGDLYDLAKDRPLKLLAVDDVTDIHNFAAILRTAAFYGVDAVVYSQKQKRFPPAFFRIASGAPEHIKLVNLTSLPKGLGQMQKREFVLVGFSEHAEKSTQEALSELQNQSVCLVVGSEDKGISNATMRILDHCVTLGGSEAINSLNVSVASALAMERFFN